MVEFVDTACLSGRSESAATSHRRHPCIAHHVIGPRVLRQADAAELRIALLPSQIRGCPPRCGALLLAIGVIVFTAAVAVSPVRAQMTRSASPPTCDIEIAPRSTAAEITAAIAGARDGDTVCLAPDERIDVGDTIAIALRTRHLTLDGRGSTLARRATRP
jgi:hypothetical protein